MQVTELYQLIKNKGKEIHIDTLYKARGRGHMSRSLAILCEEATGIAREKWGFPEKFGDPWKCAIKRRAK